MVRTPRGGVLQGTVCRGPYRKGGNMSLQSDFEKMAERYVDLLFRVAVNLTGDGDYAERLTRRALLEANELFAAGVIAGVGIKGELLSLLRQLYVDDLRWIESISDLEEDVFVLAPSEPAAV